MPLVHDREPHTKEVVALGPSFELLAHRRSISLPFSWSGQPRVLLADGVQWTHYASVVSLLGFKSLLSQSD